MLDNWGMMRQIQKKEGVEERLIYMIQLNQIWLTCMPPGTVPGDVNSVRNEIQEKLCSSGYLQSTLYYSVIVGFS